MGIIDHFSNFIEETEHFGGKNGATEFRFSAFVIRYNASPIQGPTMQYVLVNTVPFSSLFFSFPFAKNSLFFIPEGQLFFLNAQNSFNFKTLHIATTFFTRQQPGKLLFF